MRGYNFTLFEMGNHAKGFCGEGLQRGQGEARRPARNGGLRLR